MKFTVARWNKKRQDSEERSLFIPDLWAEHITREESHAEQYKPVGLTAWWSAAGET